ncbi:MAG: UDP-N-acetylmuramoyl-L-alanine--D-glutamate ligase [Desulfuromonas sp.]|nr:MAG: UDP-N-acetylmuramoyl-L-alanine--D-glutamate ligase [Desulfuromonas sp.]
MTNYAGQKVVIVGAGQTGLALATFFVGRGARVTLSDRRERGAIKWIEQLNEHDVHYDLGGHDPREFETADLVVLSPGVPLTTPAVDAACKAGVQVVGEVEIAARELDVPIIGITGTNGKSTVTTLVGEIYRAWDKRVFVGGNLGTPLISAVGQAWDRVVVELSSFQLEALDQFHVNVAMLLNISEDHLDRYPDMASYIAAKAHLFDRQQPTDMAVLNADDQQVLENVHGQARRVQFSASRVPDEGIGYDGQRIVWRYQGQEQSFDAGDLQIPGLHNIENVMAALVPALLDGCPAKTAWRAVCAFTGLPHRMQVVRKLDGVTWFNDSKGTNVGSMVKSLAGLGSPVTLIAGGKDKGGEYAPLCDLLRDKVPYLLLIGDARERMAAELKGCSTIEMCCDLHEAVTRAQVVTPAGGTVLLSPGCSSFDMFNSFEERGEIYTAEVNALTERGER